jgi:glutathione S-transferase
MYKLFHAPGSAAMAPHIMLVETGAPYELVSLDMAAGAHKAPDYLKINPNGRVPTLLDGDQIVYESAAIVMYLADRHPETGLAPAPGSKERGAYYQWLTWLTNTLQDTYVSYFGASRYAASEGAQAEVKAMAEQRLQPLFAILDQALATGPYLLGAKCSAPDIYLTMLARWSRNMAKPATTYPNIKRCVDLVRARPAVGRVFEIEGLS